MAPTQMSAFRRRLASGALLLTMLQFALLLAAPLSACCIPGALEVTRVENAKIECCPAGSHAPGECPLHPPSRNITPTASAGQVPMDRESKDPVCRMACGAPDVAQILIGTIGVLPAPQSSHLYLTASALHPGAPITATARPSVPDAPPPRLL
jgi:hypothetical protein